MEMYDLPDQVVLDTYINPQNLFGQTRINRIMSKIAIESGENLLDLGCAFGTFSRLGKKMGAVTVGLDRDFIVLKKSRDLAKRNTLDIIQTACGDGGILPFRNETFDAIINADFIEHIDNDTKKQVFNEMYRVLKKGGRGIVYSPNLNKTRWELFGERIKRSIYLRSEPVPKWRDFVDPGHFGLTSPSNAKRLLKQAGFSTDVYYYEYHMPFFSKIRFLDNLTKTFFSSYFAFRYLIKVLK